MPASKLRKPNRPDTPRFQDVDPKLMLFMVDYPGTDPQLIGIAEDRSHADAWLDGFRAGECAAHHAGNRVAELMTGEKAMEIIAGQMRERGYDIRQPRIGGKVVSL